MSVSEAAPGHRLTQDDEPESKDNSDFHLERLEELEEKLREDGLGQIFVRWREHPAAAKKFPASSHPAYGYSDEEKHELGKLAGIRWGELEAAAAGLERLAGREESLGGQVRSLGKRLDQAWQGSAADSAREQYDALAGPIGDCCDSAGAFARVLRKAAAVPRSLVGEGEKSLSGFKERSNFWRLYGTDLDNGTDWSRDIDVMQERVEEPLTINLWDVRTPESPFHAAVRDRVIRSAVREHGRAKVDEDLAGSATLAGDVRLTWDDLRLLGVPKCTAGMAEFSPPRRMMELDAFCAWYALDVENLRKRIHEAYTLTAQAWNELRNQLEGLDADPFGKLSMAGAQAPVSGEQPTRPPAPREPVEGQQAPPGPGAGGDGPQSDDVTAGGSGGSSAGAPGGGAPSGAAGGGVASADQAPRTSPPPEMPASSRSSETPPPPQFPESARTSEPPEASRSGDAAPSPEDPARPASGPFAPPELSGEEITVGEGADRISVQEPDRNGTVALTVLGEDGRPCTYEIGFGEGIRADVPQQSDPDQPSGRPDGESPGAGPSAPPPDTASPAGANEALRVPVGPDGSAVIEDGPRTITVEQTPSGELSVDVDTGDGSPRSYTVAFGDEQDAGERSPFIPPQGQDPSYSGPEQPPATQSVAADTPSGKPDNTEPSAPGARPDTSPAPGFGQDPVAGPDMSEPVPTGAIAGSATPQAAPPADLSGGPAPTTPQSSGFASMSGLDAEGMQNSFGSASGSLFSSADTGDGSRWDRPSDPQQPQGGATGLPSMGGEPRSVSAQGATGLASMGSAGGEAQTGSSGTGGGMMPMGGMAGAGRPLGGDEERSNDSPWRTQGRLFDDGVEPGVGFRYRTVLGEDEEK